MPKIERSVDYTFQAYSGDKNNLNPDSINFNKDISDNNDDKDVSSDEGSKCSE